MPRKPLMYVGRRLDKDKTLAENAPQGLEYVLEVVRAAYKEFMRERLPKVYGTERLPKEFQEAFGRPHKLDKAGEKVKKILEKVYKAKEGGKYAYRSVDLGDYTIGLSTTRVSDPEKGKAYWAVFTVKDKKTGKKYIAVVGIGAKRLAGYREDKNEYIRKRYVHAAIYEAEPGKLPEGIEMRGNRVYVRKDVLAQIAKDFGRAIGTYYRKKT